MFPVRGRAGRGSGNRRDPWQSADRATAPSPAGTGRERRDEALHAFPIHRRPDRGALSHRLHHRHAARGEQQRFDRRCQAGTGEDDHGYPHRAARRLDLPGQRQPNEQRREGGDQILPPCRERQQRGDQSCRCQQIKDAQGRIAAAVTDHDDERGQGGTEGEKLDRVDRLRRVAELPGPAESRIIFGWRAGGEGEHAEQEARWVQAEQDADQRDHWQRPGREPERAVAAIDQGVKTVSRAGSA